MKRLLFNIVLISILVVYIYSIVFKVFPISTKIILEAIGLLFCVKYIASPKYRLRKEYWTIIKIIGLLVVWDIITSIINGQFEFHLIKYHLPAIGSIFCAQMIFSYTKKYFKFPEEILMAIVVTIFLESLLTIIMKIYPPAFDMVSSVLRFEFLDNPAITFDLSRFIGIGNAIFFGVLASCSLGVMASVYLMNQTNSGLIRFFLIVMWIVISIVSFFSARWSITLIGLSIMMLVLSQRGVNIGKMIVTIFGIGIVVAVAFVIVMNNIDDELYVWAFSFLLDSSSSQDHTQDYLIDWYTSTSFDIKTFIIGDAIYSLPNGLYYGYTDVGYFRQIYYGGVIGLLLNLLAHCKVLIMAYKYKKTKGFKFFLMFLILGYLAILGKGDATMLTFYILILVYYSGGAYEYVSTRKVIKQNVSNIESISE